MTSMSYEASARSLGRELESAVNNIQLIGSSVEYNPVTNQYRLTLDPRGAKLLTEFVRDRVLDDLWERV